MMDWKDVLTWLGAVFGLGVVWGRAEWKTGQLERENLKREDEIDDLSRSHSLSMEAIAKKSAIDIEALKQLFVTHDNEPRFITYAAHDKLQAGCQNMIMLQINFIKDDQAKIRSCQERIEKILLGKIKVEG